MSTEALLKRACSQKTLPSQKKVFPDSDMLYAWCQKGCKEEHNSTNGQKKQGTSVADVERHLTEGPKTEVQDN